MFPVQHVWTYRMRPMHISPDSGTRIVLEEHVVAAIPEDWTIGIVHPVARGKQVKLRTQ